MVRAAGCARGHWRGKPESGVWPLTVFVNHLFPRISLIRELWLWNGDYYGRWWMEIAFPLIVNPPIFTTSHRSPRPLSTATCTNWADCCKMCVCVWCVFSSLQLGCMYRYRRGRGFYPAWLPHAQTWDQRNKGLMSNILSDRHPNVEQREKETEKLLKPEHPCPYRLQGYEWGPIQ